MESEVRESLLHLKVGKAYDFDIISSRILKECAGSLSKPLTFIFNLSLSFDVFPGQWNVSKIQPIFMQEGDRSQASNYRPVFLLCSALLRFQVVRAPGEKATPLVLDQ